MNRFLLRRIVDLDARAEAFEMRGRNREAVGMREEVCRLVEAHLGADHLWRITRLLGLASTCRRSGDHQRAEELYLEAIRRFERRECAEGGSSLGLARALNALGVLYCETARPALAVEAFEHALELSKATGAPSDSPSPALAAIFDNLSSAYRALADFERAQASSAEALAIHERAGVEMAAEQAHCLCDLAELAAETGRLEESEGHATAALSSCRRAPPERRAAAAEVLMRLACYYRRARRAERALDLCEEAAMSLQGLGQGHEGELVRCLGLMGELRRELDTSSVGPEW